MKSTNTIVGPILLGMILMMLAISAGQSFLGDPEITLITNHPDQKDWFDETMAIDCIFTIIVAQISVTSGNGSRLKYRHIRSVNHMDD